MMMVKSRKSWPIFSHPSLSFSLLVLHQSSISLIKRSRKPAATDINHNEEQIDTLYNPATAIFLTELLKASISFTILLIQSSDHPQSSPQLHSGLSLSSASPSAFVTPSYLLSVRTMFTKLSKCSFLLFCIHYKTIYHTLV
ncbi:hypothetical protein KEM48_004359 [Puccinia striiformis f. sp. tritici PST-130]|nr:hypothetical protein KEM48_004359 [Puccinia striiformis f. sp. tritici PST-130]